MKSSEPKVLDSHQLLNGDWDQISVLLMSSYPKSTQNNATEGSTDIEYAARHFVSQLFKNYVANSKLHPQLSKALKPLQVVSEAVLLDKTLPWRHRCLHATIALIQNSAIGWEPNHGRAADNYWQQLNNILSNIKESCDLDQAKKVLNAFFEKESKRISKLEKRLIDTETGRLQARHANQLSAKNAQ